MNFSIKTLGWLVIWFSLVMALFMYARSEAYPRNSYPIGFASELLLMANSAFCLVAISLAIGGAFKNRFWMATSAIAIIMVAFQVYDGSVNSAIYSIAGNLLNVLTESSTATVSSNWVQNHTTEFTKLLTYAWTPVISVVCGCIADWKSKFDETKLNFEE